VDKVNNYQNQEREGKNMLKAKNPIITGFHPDPSICRVGDDYYIATSTFQWFPGVQLYHSRDLINWEELPSPLSRKSQLDMVGNPNSGGIWGPCLSYCDGTFYLIYTNTKNFHGIFKDTPNYLVTTRDIYSGEWSEPIYLNSSGFDPSLFHDDDGRKYLLNMRWDHRVEFHDFAGIVIQEYSEKEKRLIGKPKTIYKGTEIGATEAPHMYKRNGYYYLMVAEGGTMYNHGIRMARSKELFGTYESDPMPLLTARNNPESPLQRTGHGSLVDTKNGEWYVPYLCGRPIGERGRCILGRETAIAQVVWDENGWIRLKDGGVVPPTEYSVSLPEYKYEKAPECDHFDMKELSPKYKTLRIPLSDFGTLNERKGYLRLYGYQAITSWNKQALVARRLQHHNAESTIKMEFNPSNFQQMAGLTVMYDTYNFFYLYMSNNEEGENVLRICVRDSLNFYNPLNGAVSIGQSTTVWLRVKIDGCKLTFYYSLDGEKYNEIGGELDCSCLSDEAYADIGHEGHTGTFIGMACQDLSNSREGLNCYADFEFMSYKGI
jgi:xylan 1,4-beta-xylosidase